MSDTFEKVSAELAAKQDELAKVFAEAKTDDGKYAFDKVTCLGAQVKGAIAVAEKVNQMNAELDELGEKAETLRKAEEAASGLADREKARRNFPLPGTTGTGTKFVEGFGAIKSLGEAVLAEKAFKDWQGAGAAGGVTLQFDDVLPSDIMAKALQFETIGTKALMTTAAGYLMQPIRQLGFVEAAARPIQLLDIIPMAQTGYDSVPYMEETTRVHAAAMAAEGAAYAESSFVFTERTSPVRKITDSVPVTDEQLDDAPMVESYLNGRLVFGLRQKLDSQVLIGDATGANLRGIKNVVGIQTQAKAADPVPDAFYKAMTKVRLTGRAIPTHHVMHPTNWQDVRLLRTAEGVYIWGNPSEAGPERMWGLPVVQEDADAAGTGYVGSFQPAWLSLFERRGVDVQVGFVGTQFTEGKRTIRGDMRMAFIVFRPAAFCQVTGL